VRVALNVLVVLLMYSATLPFLSPAMSIDDQPLHPAVWFLVLASAAANIIVIAYHYSVPPHPKFLVVPWRRWILRTHILSGTVELCAGLAALFMPERELAAKVMALAALGFHVPSAYAQTPIVFGARAIMRPAYLLCIGLHAFSAVQLWRHPSSLYWVSSTFLIFNIYGWCRIYYFIFDKFGLFQGARYSVTILSAGLTTAPVVLGSSGMPMMVIGCGVYMALSWVFFLRRGGDWREFVREAARDSTVPDELRALWLAPNPSRDRQAAQECFASLEGGADGAVANVALERLLTASGIPRSAVQQFTAKRGGEPMPFDQFMRTVWSIREVREAASAQRALPAARSARDKAELVFQRLDMDGDGRLGRGELEVLLRGWSLPAREVDRWLERTGLAQEGSIDFAAFFKHLTPVWKFIYYDIVEAKYGTREDMIQRAFTARRDDSDAVRIRAGLERELAGKVPFLAGAPTDVLDEFARSLVEERVRAGDTVFVQGDAGDAFFIVRSGRLRLTRDDETIAELTVGDYLGEGALLADAPRSATARALDDVGVLRMTRASFRYLLDRHGALRSAVEQIHEGRRLEEMQRAVHRELMGKVPFLHDANHELMDALAQALEGGGRCLVSAGTVVFAEGEPGDALYLIGRGTIDIARGGERVAELGPGAFFGEGALLSGEARGATAIVQTDAVLYRLMRSTFEHLLGRFPTVAAAVQQAHAARQTARRLALLRRLPSMRGANPEALDRLERAMVRVPLAAGETLFREGDVSDRLYVVSRGVVHVEKAGAHIAKLEDGAWFDERTVREQRPRAATILAGSDVELLALERDVLLSVPAPPSSTSPA
jgi:CRP-like cAMP-binding protein/Ca2+-binding EF-hand superfamily protein